MWSYRVGCRSHQREKVRRRPRKGYEDVCICKFPDETSLGMCTCGGMIAAVMVNPAQIYTQNPELRKQVA